MKVTKWMDAWRFLKVKALNPGCFSVSQPLFPGYAPDPLWPWSGPVTGNEWVKEWSLCMSFMTNGDYYLIAAVIYKTSVKPKEQTFFNFVESWPRKYIGILKEIRRRDWKLLEILGQCTNIFNGVFIFVGAVK